MKKSFKTYSEEKSKDDQLIYDSIISKSEFNQYLTSIKCRLPAWTKITERLCSKLNIYNLV